MYKIIGADNKVYGPVAVEQLRQWLQEGRANAQTQVQPEGATDWKPLGSLPEFADLLGSAAPPPIAPPAVKADPDALAAEILARGYDIDIGSCISRGWELVKNDFWLLVGSSFLIEVIYGAVGIIGGPLFGGLNWLFLKRMRRQPGELGDAFAGFTLAFLPLFVSALLMTLLGLVGCLFCLIPGIYLLVSWTFVLPLIVDKKLDFWPAMELSRKVVAKHFWAILGLMFVVTLVEILGLLLCCVGVFVTKPIGRAAVLYAYEDIFGTRPTQTA
jgi:hypothetical protein